TAGEDCGSRWELMVWRRFQQPFPSRATRDQEGNDYCQFNSLSSCEAGGEGRGEEAVLTSASASKVSTDPLSVAHIGDLTLSALRPRNPFGDARHSKFPAKFRHDCSSIDGSRSAIPRYPEQQGTFLVLRLAVVAAVGRAEIHRVPRTAL